MPPIRPADYQILVKIFEQDGFTFSRQRGDHLIYTKPGIKRPLVIPMYKGVRLFIVKNLLRCCALVK